MQSFKQIRDKDMAFTMLNNLKYTCDCINTKLLETSNMQLRQSYINILNETYNEQKQLFDIMSQRNWYQPTMAQQQELSQAASRINNMQGELMQIINTSNNLHQNSTIGHEQNYQMGQNMSGNTMGNNIRNNQRY